MSKVDDRILDDLAAERDELIRRVTGLIVECDQRTAEVKQLIARWPDHTGRWVWQQPDGTWTFIEPGVGQRGGFAGRETAVRFAAGLLPAGPEARGLK